VFEARNYDDNNYEYNSVCFII